MRYLKREITDACGPLRQNAPVPTPDSSKLASLDASIDPEELVRDLERLLEVPSIGGTDAEVRVQEDAGIELERAGLDVHSWTIDVDALLADPAFPGQEVDRRHALGVLGLMPGTGGGRSLLIDVHTDVVPPGDLNAWSGDPFKPRRGVIEGRPSVLGRGACDMKAGAVAALAAVAAVRRSGITLRGDVVFAPVCGEEDGGFGTFALLGELQRRNIQPTMCVVPEPTSMDLVPANGGALTFRLRVHGKATHASRRTEGVSAIEKLAPLLVALRELETERNADVDPLMRRWPIAYPISIGTVSAGDWASTVPDLLVAEGRYGVALHETVQDARAALEHAIAEACARDPWLRDHPVDVEWWGGQFAPGLTDDTVGLLPMLGDIHEELTGVRPQIYGGPYGSDLRLLSGIGGIPTVQYGPGDAKAAHAPDEYVPVDEVVLCARAIARLIVTTCA